MEEKLIDLTGEGSLTEELSDEELAACVGGTGIIVNLLSVKTEVPLVEQHLIKLDASADLGIVSAQTDPNGSGRWTRK